MHSPVRHKGKITQWNDARGFGFIAPEGRGEKVFLHISVVKPRSRRPAVGDQVTFAVTRASGGRPQARGVRLTGAGRVSRKRDIRLPRVTIGLAALVLVAIVFSLNRLPPVLAGAYFVFSVLSFFAYMRDKRAAARDAWRTSESTLHLLDLAGGWPGGIIAQRLFRHKTVKPSFQFGFWFTVVANMGGVWWLTVSGLAAQLAVPVVG